MAYNVKFLKGTQANFDGLQSKDVNTFYYVDSKDLYLGNVKLTNGADLTAAVQRVAKTESDIESIKTSLGSLTQVKFDALVERMTAAEGKITAAEGKITTLEGKVSTAEGKISTLEGTVAGHTTSIGNLNTGLSNLTEAAATKTALAEVKATADAAEAAITVLNSDGEGSVKAAVAAGIAEVVAGADKDFDTLKEVADWILNDTIGAAQMQTDVAQLKTDVAGHGTRLGAAEGEIDTLQSEMDAVEALADKADKASQANAAEIETIKGNVKDNADAIDAVEQAVKDEESRAKGIEEGLANRLAIVEDLTGAGGEGETGAISEQIATAKAEAIEAAQKDAASQVSESAATLRGEISTAKQEAIDAAATDAAKLYATKAQGALADTALQAADISTGSNNGTILVDGSEVLVAGLKSAAFQEASAFDAKGSAAAAETAAKSYADGLAKNYDAKGAAAAAETAAKTYVDTALTWGAIV